jgi:menaquinone-specific isochorismate synthase
MSYPLPYWNDVPLLLEQQVIAAWTQLPPDTLCRIQLAVLPTEPADWLAAQAQLPGIYWEDRARRWSAAGIGQADWEQSLQDDDLLPLDMLKRRAAAAPGLRYYGGVRFSPLAPVSELWRAFGSYYFVAPRFELRREGRHYSLACQFRTPKHPQSAPPDSLLSEIRRLAPPCSMSAPAPPALGDFRHQPSFALWEEQLEQLQVLFDQGELNKLVMARRSSAPLSTPMNPRQLLRHMRTQHQGEAFRYLFQLSPDSAFMGLSPERLYRRRGLTLHTESVAGTRRLGDTPEETLHLGETLMHSAKDRHEHSLVTRFLEERLGQLCSAAQTAPLTLLRTNGVQHLYQRLEGQLHPEVSDAHILRALHPTPAMGGDPAPQAAAWLPQIETFDRGWYAAPVGWLDGEGAEFAVGIRSLVLTPEQVHFFVGAGIVPGSVASEEWQELNAKLAPLQSMFALMPSPLCS